MAEVFNLKCSYLHAAMLVLIVCFLPILACAEEQEATSHFQINLNNKLCVHVRDSVLQGKQELNPNSEHSKQNFNSLSNERTSALDTGRHSNEIVYYLDADHDGDDEVAVRVVYDKGPGSETSGLFLFQQEISLEQLQKGRKYIAELSWDAFFTFAPRTLRYCPGYLDSDKAPVNACMDGLLSIQPFSYDQKGYFLIFESHAKGTPWADQLEAYSVFRAIKGKFSTLPEVTPRRYDESTVETICFWTHR